MCFASRQARPIATMGCGGTCTAEKFFVFINITFAMYGGALLATAARLFWDPSTYMWFRFMCEDQYNVTTAYIFATGVWLVVLVFIATTAVHPRIIGSLQIYFYGMVILILSQIAYGAWFGITMWDWWQHSPKAETMRNGMAWAQDFERGIRVFTNHKEEAKLVINMIEEMERKLPNNAIVVAVFLVFAVFLQVFGLVVSWILKRGAIEDKVPKEIDKPPKNWRKKANLHVYAIIDKIF